jgi:hypothetical protein
MAVIKKEDSKRGSSAHGGGGHFLGPLLGSPVIVTLLITAVFVGIWWGAWQWLGPEVLSSPRYLVNLNDVELTPLPAWIHTDVRAEAFRNLTFVRSPSVLDEQLAQRVADAFALHPWVAKVRRVTKLAPARIRIDIEYRRPVCMVQVPGGLYPVDAEGTWLPSNDFSPVEADGYPCLTGVDTLPVGSVGTRWGDARVLGGAEIAAAFGPAWSRLGLRWIVPSERPVSGDQYAFEVFARSGTQILWGVAPSGDRPETVPQTEKVARLVKYFEEHRSLDAPAGPQQIDLRGPQGLVIAPRTAAAPTERAQKK